MAAIALGTKTDLGNYLTDANGMALYYFDKDTKGVSNCTGKCLEKWPVFYAPTFLRLLALTQLTLVHRFVQMARMQATYQRFPVVLLGG